MFGGLMTRFGHALSERVPDQDDSEIETGPELQRPNTCVYSYYYDVCNIWELTKIYDYSC